MHSVDVFWECAGDFAGGSYSRAHVWRFDGGVEVAASASPSVVPPPMSVAEAVDPEEAFIASISSCHMLWFLDIARREGFRVARYADRAEGALARDGGQVWIPEVVLNVRVTFDGPAPDTEVHRGLHDAAHHACFIANSVKTDIVVRLSSEE